MAMGGLSRRGMETICTVLNLPRPLNKNRWQAHLRDVYDASEATAKSSSTKAVEEEVNLTGDRYKLAVSGDGSWRKQGFSSLHGIVLSCDVMV